MDPEQIDIIADCCVDKSSKVIPHSRTRIYITVITNIISLGINRYSSIVLKVIDIRTLLSGHLIFPIN